MSADSMARLNISRKELLDLGLRNPLINHRNRAKQVKVVDEISAETYRILVSDGKNMRFKALPAKKAEEIAKLQSGSGSATITNPADWNNLLAQPAEEANDSGPAKRHTDRILQSALLSEKLQTSLLSIHNNARTSLEEQGINILYLALGFLYWYESPSAQEARRAPLLLIPVSLKRANAQERFQVSYTGEDIGDNLSLSEKLRSEFRIKLPEIENGDELDVNAYMSGVSKAIKTKNRWRVEPDEITLGFFSFGKLLMYKDLEAGNWPESTRGQGFSTLDALLTSGFREPSSDFSESTNIDEVVSPSSIQQVKDADSTQTLAILDVKSGRNLVLQGPPGTGKSQTITNIIAECIGNGKKVLFVSEKMAALDVVKRRLDDVFLGDAVIELHSHKTNKKRMLAELDRTLHQGRPRWKNRDGDVSLLTRLRNELNAYSEAVNRPIGKTRTSFVNALGFALKNHINELKEQAFPFQHMEEWDESDYRAARIEIEKLDYYIADAGPPANNPFEASKLTEFLPSQRSPLERLLSEGITSIEHLQSKAAELSQYMGFDDAVSRSDIINLCKFARRAMEAPDLDDIVLKSEEWLKQKSNLFNLFLSGRTLNQAHSLYDEWLIDSAWNQDILDVRQQFVAKGSKWWRILSGDFRQANTKLRGLCHKELPKDVSAIIEMIDTILDCQKHQKRYDQFSKLGKELYGTQWADLASDWGKLEKLTEWILKLYHDINEGIIPDGIVSFLAKSQDRKILDSKVCTVDLQLEEHLKIVNSIIEFLKLQNEARNSLKDDSLENQSNTLSYWRSSIDELFPLTRFNTLALEFHNKGLSFAIATSLDWSHKEGTLVKLFDYSWYYGLVEKAYLETKAIKTFDRNQHASIMKKFSELDQLLFRHNQAHLAIKHWEALPKFNDGGELAIIAREANKKRRHMPIRKLMSEAGRAIQAIKPIFMMSPMSIATYIPPGSVQFDLVVFDEASQVKPVDAFGAIIRGNQAVVVGDSKQLPPTSFFDSLVDSSEEDDFESTGDVESILSLFVGKGAPERMLRWHYRSRHDSLIAVSNYEFYDNRLVVFPSPGSNQRARGLRLNHLPDTIYDRGKTRSNLEEAKAVALAVMEHARDQPDLSLGVAAFSTAQRDAIELQLEILRRKDLSCEPFFNENEQEPFFIKNLENVQGDERDIIFISIGYGKSAKGYMSMSFGPLNRDGGERRLNVLITRARLAMDVFSNFTADDIDLNRTKAKGVIALKNFLAYAETGNLQQPYTTEKEPDSPFEEAVIKALCQNGVEVEPQVGTAGFFIDIAVKDPDKPGHYILGIECDGATYHSSRSARDRDRLRQEVLEGLGWQLHRIWSTEWYRNQQRELERALDAIEKARLSYKRRSSQHKVKLKTVMTKGHQLRRDVPPSNEKYSSGLAKPYIRASVKINLHNRQLHELPKQVLLSHIMDVVEQEAPMHTSELIRRITEGAGLKRAGNRIRSAIEAAIMQGRRTGRIVSKKEFLWKTKMQTTPVRDRTDLDSSSKRFEYVPPEEIRNALEITINNGFSMSRDDAYSCAARLLGFQRVTEQTRSELANNLDVLIRTKVLESRNGLIMQPNT